MPAMVKMISLGSRARTSSTSGGTCNCARERGRRRYRFVVVRLWLRVGPFPVVPIEELSRFVECCSCASTFEAEVLVGPNKAQVEDVLTASLRRAAAAVLSSSNGALSPIDRREAVIVLQRYANVPYSSHDLDADLAMPSGASPHNELRDLAPSLNDHGREAVLNAIAQLAVQNRGESGQRLEALRQVTRAFGAV